MAYRPDDAADEHETVITIEAYGDEKTFIFDDLRFDKLVAEEIMGWTDLDVSEVEVEVYRGMRIFDRGTMLPGSFLIPEQPAFFSGLELITPDQLRCYGPSPVLFPNLFVEGDIICLQHPEENFYQEILGAWRRQLCKTPKYEQDYQLASSRAEVLLNVAQSAWCQRIRKSYRELTEAEQEDFYKEHGERIHDEAFEKLYERLAGEPIPDVIRFDYQ